MISIFILAITLFVTIFFRFWKASKPNSHLVCAFLIIILSSPFYETVYLAQGSLRKHYGGCWHNFLSHFTCPTISCPATKKLPEQALSEVSLSNVCWRTGHLSLMTLGIWDSIQKCVSVFKNSRWPSNRTNMQFSNKSMFNNYHHFWYIKHMM